MDPIAADSVKPSDATGEPFRLLTHFGGFDWATEQHQFAVVAEDGTVLSKFCFNNDAEGWAQLRAQTAQYPRLGVVIETGCGPAVERLLELGVIVYPLNPKAAERFRDRKARAGVKNDALDAWCFIFIEAAPPKTCPYARPCRPRFLRACRRR